MFKSNLIDNPAYYATQRTLFLLAIPGAILFGIWFGMDRKPLWALTVICLIAAGITIWRIRVQRQAMNMVRNRKIEISPDIILIKSEKGKILESIPTVSIERILLNYSSNLPDESVPDIIQSLKGQSVQNYIILDMGNEQRRFDIVLESHYMIEQLNKVVSLWTRSGKPVEFIE